MRYRLNAYNGRYSNPNILNLFQRFPSIVSNAERTIFYKLGIPPPPDDVEIVFNLADVEGIPMITPTGQATPTSDNRFNIDLSAYAVANDFWGLTSTEKVMTHELVHSYFMYYGGLNYRVKPTWIKEGIALWTAGQTFDSDFSKVPIDMRNSRWVDYLGYITMFENALSRNTISGIVRYMIS